MVRHGDSATLESSLWAGTGPAEEGGRGVFRFLLGVIVGAAGATWLLRAHDQGQLDRRLAEMQDRANAVLMESRRVLEEVRREVGAAVEAGRRSVESRAERIRRAPEVQPQPEDEGEGKEQPGQA